ncbi:sodium:proton antiporter [Oxynema sp. CENA135]|uniref:cation:proton antiporter domain-containing protein n=1 Tax=Oxynema sp. CENA135 TaxID=984206 RepID=UPI00190E08DD|nr:sodium:proton antiporter [Oxynema sp. CENA135]MBK4731427.1 sodium:proton antiporter [Oxynema sp. CENA135]
MGEFSGNELDIALTALGGLVLVLGLLSGFLKERLFLSDPLVAVCIGILLGPSGLHLLDLSHWGNPQSILEQGARLAIAIQLMGVALRLPKGYLLRHWKAQAVLLGLVMPLSCVASAVLVYFILGLPLWVALLVGAIVTPTDPVVATAIVTGKVAERNLPDRLRHTLSAESAANDGLAYPLVFLPILFLTRSPGEALGQWFGEILLWEVGATVVLGAVCGYLAGWLLLRAERQHTIDKPSFLAYTLALSLLVLGGIKLLHGDGILAVFVAGSTFSLVVSGSERSQEERVQEAVDRFFTLYVFVLFGLGLPWREWFDLGWSGAIAISALLLLRRLPVLFLLKSCFPHSLQRNGDLLFMGWFGPMGVAAIFYAMLAIRETQTESIWAIVSAVVCASIVVHGISAIPGAKRYGQRHSPQAPPRE